MSSTATASTVWASPGDASWVALSARFRHLVAAVARRDDLVVKVGPDTRPAEQQEASPRATACFVPRLAELHFTANKIWDAESDHPDRIDPNDPLDRVRHPQMMGAACHEAAHAAHTRLHIDSTTDAATAHWCVLLEEPRVEARLVARRPADRVWLRAGAVTLVGGGAVALHGDSRYTAARAAVLFLGRVAAGVLHDSDVADLRQQIAEVLGEATLAAVEDVLTGTVRVEDGDTGTLLGLAQQLMDLVQADIPDETDTQDGEHGGQQQDAADSAGEAASTTGSGDGSDSPARGDQAGDDGEGASPGTGAGCGQQETPQQATPEGDRRDPSSPARQLPCGSWTEGHLPDGTDPWSHTAPAPPTDEGSDTPAVTEAIRTAAEAVAADAARKASRAAFTPPPRNPIQQARDQDAQITQQAHTQTFGTQGARIRVAERTATPAAQEQARRLTWALRRAQFRGVTRSTTPAITPPGRMRMDEIMRRHAQQDAGTRITARPWRRTHRREVPRPPLTVGFSGDVSGSMQRWQQVVADTAWAVGQAVTHLAGTVAAVAWNTDVAPTVRPGEHPRQVREALCGGGSAGCPLSLRALDGALRLTTNPDGARVVVVVTDGALGDTYPQINVEIARLARCGVRVLWVTPHVDHNVANDATNLVLADPGRFGERIGQALVDMLAQAGRG